MHLKTQFGSLHSLIMLSHASFPFLVSVRLLPPLLSALNQRKCLSTAGIEKAKLPHRSYKLTFIVKNWPFLLLDTQLNVALCQHCISTVYIIYNNIFYLNESKSPPPFTLRNDVKCQQVACSKLTNPPGAEGQIQMNIKLRIWWTYHQMDPNRRLIKFLLVGLVI